MKRLLVEYCNIIGYTLTGLVFGIAFFLLFLNFYHYREVNDVYVKQESDFEINDDLKNKLSLINSNISSVDLNTYSGSMDKNSLSIIQTKLDNCISEIDTDQLSTILSKSKINIKDVYEMQQFYNTNISNNCMIKQIYPMITEDSPINPLLLDEVKPFLEDNINQLEISTDYLQKVIKNNTSYYFVSDSTKSDVYHQIKDSYYSVFNSYTNAIDFIYDISIWYKKKIGG